MNPRRICGKVLRYENGANWEADVVASRSKRSGHADHYAGAWVIAGEPLFPRRRLGRLGGVLFGLGLCRLFHLAGAFPVDGEMDDGGSGDRARNRRPDSTAVG